MESIESWEKLRDRYFDMGGQTVQGDEQCVILLKMLPPDTPATMVMALEEYTDFDALKAKLEKQTDWLLDRPVTGNPRIQLVDGQGPVPAEQPLEPSPSPFEEEVVDLISLDPDHQAHTLAVMRQNRFRGKVRTSAGATGGSAGRRPETPPAHRLEVHGPCAAPIAEASTVRLIAPNPS